MKTKIHEIERFHNRNHVFRDRFEAGDVLAQMLESNYGGQNVIVLAIPSGGVPVGIRISEHLQAPLDLVIVRKLQLPGNPEAGFGAMTQEGSVFLNEKLLVHLNLRESDIKAETRRVREELDRRNQLFRKEKAFPDLSEKRVILVDDGLASGFTMLASIHMVNKQKARETVIAVPTAPQRTIDRMKDEVQQIYCPNIRETLSFAVAEAYQHWYDLDEEEVQSLLSGYQQR
ncbi:MAG: phosphoribosyltransferase family protein [Desulfatiglandaceae bacterium]